MIWLDEPPYVMRSTCPDCWLGCTECTLDESSCLCETCPEERWEQANADH